MLYGAMLRPPSYGAQLESVDLTPGKKLGVVAVRDGGDLSGCAAKTSYQARNAVEAIGKDRKVGGPRPIRRAKVSAPI